MTYTVYIENPKASNKQLLELASDEFSKVAGYELNI